MVEERQGYVPVKGKNKLEPRLQGEHEPRLGVCFGGCSEEKQIRPLQCHSPWDQEKQDQARIFPFGLDMCEHAVLVRNLLKFQNPRAWRISFRLFSPSP